MYVTREKQHGFRLLICDIIALTYILFSMMKEKEILELH
jgi:hypothetical protein